MIGYTQMTTALNQRTPPRKHIFAVVTEVATGRALDPCIPDTSEDEKQEFSKRVLWANLLAWPIAYYCANRWLDGFAYHVDLKIWMFLAAGGIALVIALLTVSGHAFLAARAKPVTALRYE